MLSLMGVKGLVVTALTPGMNAEPSFIDFRCKMESYKALG